MSRYVRKRELPYDPPLSPRLKTYLAAFDQFNSTRLASDRERMVELIAPVLPKGVGIVKHRRH